jgi:hypothetical protein
MNQIKMRKLTRMIKACKKGLKKLKMSRLKKKNHKEILLMKNWIKVKYLKVKSRNSKE